MLAILADLYTPLLMVMCVMLIKDARPAERRGLLCTLTACLAIAWGLMWLDRLIGIWAQYSLDYSTHTAVALALLICLLREGPRNQVPWWTVSALAYALLMVMLGYHSIADIATTALAAGSLMLLAAGLCWHCQRDRAPK